MIFQSIDRLIQIDREQLAGTPASAPEKRRLTEIVSQGVGANARHVSAYMADLYMSNLLSHKLEMHRESACFPEFEGDEVVFPKLAALRRDARKKAALSSRALELFLSSNFGIPASQDA